MNPPPPPSPTPLPGVDTASPLAPHHDYLVQERAQGRSYDVIAAALQQRGIQTSAAAVGRYCRKHLAGDPAGSVGGGSALPAAPSPAWLAELDELLESAGTDLRKMIDTQLKPLATVAVQVEDCTARIAQVEAGLRQQPAQWAKRIDADLRTPVADTVTRVGEMAATLQKLLSATRGALAQAERRLWPAVFLLGATAGALGSWLILSR